MIQCICGLYTMFPILYFIEMGIEVPHSWYITQSPRWENGLSGLGRPRTTRVIQNP